MKKIKTFTYMLCLAAILLSFSGCLSDYLVLSKEDVLLKLTEQVNGREPTSAKLTLDLALSTEIDGVPTDMSVRFNGNTMIASNTDSYAEGELLCANGSSELRSGAQIYNLAENGNLLTFTHIDSTDQWYRSETALPAPTPAPSASSDETAEISIPDEYAFLILEEGTQTLNDAEAYMLTGSAAGEACKALLLDSLHVDALTARLQSLSPDVKPLKELDFSTLTADVTVYLDKSSCQLLQIEIIVNGANTLLNDVLTMLPDHVSAKLGTSVSIHSVRAVLSDISFDPVSIPDLPEDGRIAAMQASFDPDRGDGSYILQQYGDAVKITAQDNWSLEGLSYCSASFRNSDNTEAVHFQMFRNMTDDAFIAWVESGLIPSMEEQGLIPVSAAEESIGDYRVHSITSNGVNIYIACRSVGSSLLGIYAEDSTGSALPFVLPPILDSVEAYQLSY